MVRRSLSGVAVQAALLLARAGLLPAAALLCLAAAALLHFLLLPQLQARTERDRQHLADLRAGRTAAPAAQDLAAHYNEFRTQLASEDGRGELLKSLFKLAAEAGVTLAQADYRQQPDPGCGCQRLQITLPVRGTYPQIRAFIDAALARIGALALDELSLRRENVKNTNVEAQLRLTLYLRTEE